MISTVPARLSSLVESRYSPRAFASTPLPEGYLDLLLEAAHRAPSASNQQPWRFIYAERARHPEAFENMASCLTGNNKIWAPEAPLLLCTVAQEINDKGAANPYAWHDCGQAIAWLTVQATELGLYVHQMGGFDHEKARTHFNIPEGFAPVAFSAIGFLGKPDSLPEALRVSETNRMPRKPVHEVALAGSF